MHYYIDGYNLLFRLLHGSVDLQSERESIIHDLNKKISLTHHDVSIVFDATFQKGGISSRSHYDQLEIHFTAEGETADDYILHEIKNSKSPQQETVVTSDKKLARFVKNYSAHTETVEEFISWLNRSYKNKLRLLNKEGRPAAAKAAPSQIPPLQMPKKSTKPPADAPLEAYTEYYAKLFEAKWEEILKKEQHKKEAKAAAAPPLKRPPRKPRKKQDPFQENLSPEAKAAGEMERWLKIFEQR